MDVSRRDVLAGSVFAFGASALVLGSGAARAGAGDEAAVIERVDTLRKATQEADKAKLEQVTSAQLSYGHSGGRVETKEQFINGVMTRKAVVKSLAFPELKVAVAGNAPSHATFGSPSPSSTARRRLPGSACCRSGRNRTATGSCWPAKGSACRRS
jgi:hypothetical protein